LEETSEAPHTNPVLKQFPPAVTQKACRQVFKIFREGCSTASLGRLHNLSLAVLYAKDRNT